jgi:hypothetical protein
MYTPHQYGNASLSANDRYSIQWLYRLPAGASVQKIAARHSMSTSSDIDSVIRKIDSKSEEKESLQENVKIKNNRDLMEESANIGDLKRYNMMLQNVSISENVKKYLNKNRK